ncbi:acetate/propionate family kinase [Vreelandella venusta]|uniref:acetate/propionate family kinase n=1 Tax=Vreelandella venusta TaxID=44935 RepID=UPI0022863680|nr:acetate/propionate family kinase [Halomonas venusta]WAM53886.1 acetate/propionate family kinase [Halomonas venusta]
MQEILVLNSGSSSVKFALYHINLEGAAGGAQEALTLAYSGHFSGLATSQCRVSLAHREPGQSPHYYDVQTLKALGLTPAVNHEEAITKLIAWIEQREDKGALIAIGHRVVHGGQTYFEATKLSANDVIELEKFSSLAPLHQPHGLAPIKLLMAKLPDVPQIACFDTAFHTRQPWVARQFALPRELTAKGVIRYGFHGLSYDYIQRTLAHVLPDDARRSRVVVAHLGNGASMCAIHDGVSVASSMGFTALDGLPMGTRSGALDPGVVLYLIGNEKMSIEDVSALLYKRSGLLGVSGISSDMRELLASDAPEAEEAVELYCYRAAREIASLAGALGGLDQLIFTAGIGQHAAPVRARIVTQCEWMGMQLDEKSNARDATCISSTSSRVGVWVIPTDEERVIASDCLALLNRMD